MMTVTPRALDITNLKYRYAANLAWVIDLQCLQLKLGEQMLLQGGSGCGKSTLLQLIAGLIDPVEGSILIGNKDMHQHSGAKRDLFRGRHLGMIFQTFNLLHGFTAAENVMMAMMFSDLPKKEHRTRAIDLLKQLGIETPDRSPEKLSIGQQQRVAVARAMACDPVLVLADEPTASLDPDNAANAIDLIQNICKEKNAALLCVSHDPAMAARFDRVEKLTAETRKAAAV